MRMKLTTFMFSLLLAVGWTNVAQAQRICEAPTKEIAKRLISQATNPASKQDLSKVSQTSLLSESKPESLFKFVPTERMDEATLARKFQAPNRAPRRAQYDITADKTMTRAEYEAITYDWVDANGNHHPNTKLTEPASNPYQIAYLLGSTYMNQKIPGIKYSAFYGMDHPYPNIEFGWDIPGNARWSNIPSGSETPNLYDDIVITIPSYSLDFNSILVQSNGTTVDGGSWTATANGATWPSGWNGPTITAENNGYCTSSSSGGYIVIPHRIIDGKNNVTVVMSARKYGSNSSNQTVTISNGQSLSYTTTTYTAKTSSITPSNRGGGLTIGVKGVALLRSITVYNQNNTVLTSWTYNGTTDYYTSSGNNIYYYTLPGWYYSNVMRRYIYNNAYYGLLQEHINIPASLLNGASSIRVVINGLLLSGYEGTLVVNGEEKTLTSSAANYTWTFTDINTPSGSVIPPDDNGYTVFLVKAKDNAGAPPAFTYSWNKDGFTNLVNYFDTYIDGVELLTDGTRLNENTVDAGTMFAYSGELNKFYFISKGSNYWLGSSESDYIPHYGPTYDMYEEFSPTTTATGDEVTDFYSKLLYGNSYNVLHDCRGVNPMQHYFSMSGNAGTDHKSMTNLIFWIPDNRGQQNNQNNYNTEYLPHVGLYTITLEAEAEQVAQVYEEGNRNYKVTCDWVSSLNSILDFSVDQDYELWIYVYDEDGNPVEDRKVMDLIVDENGYIHNDTQHSYYVEQKPESYTIVYRIKGWPKDATNTPGKHLEDPENGTFYALSNLAPVLIPGYNNFLALGMDHYESDFVINEEHNYYRNFLTVSNQNPNNALTAKRIKDGEDRFSLYRFDATVEEPQYVKAADLQLSVENNKVNYLIDYSNQYYIDDADQSSQSQTLTGYKDPNALGCPTYGTIANISEGGEIGTITRTWDFETDQSSQFTLLDNDGDGYNWYYQNGADTGNSYKTHSGTGLMTSASWVSSTVGALTPDNWLISPEVNLGGTLSFWACGQDTEDNNEVFGVYVYQGTYSSGTSGFVQIGSDITTTGEMAEYTFDLSAYSGKGRFAIVHHNCTDQFRLNIDDISITNQTDEAGFTLLNNFLDNSTYTQEGIVVFQEPWKSIQVKLQEHVGSASGYFVIQNDGRLRFTMPAGYNNANLRFVIHNAPIYDATYNPSGSEYADGTFTLKSSTGSTQTITIPEGNYVYGDRDYEAIFTGISSGDVISITGTHVHEGVLYNYSPDFKYIHVYVEGGHDGISDNTALNLAAIKFVDQFKAETREDKHPYRYGYVLKFEPEAGSTLEPQESAKPEVPVQHTGATLAGYYSLSEIDQDTHIGINHDEGLTMNVMNAEVDMKLTSNPQVYYYTLDRKPSTEPDANYLEISKLQKREDDTYQEMDNILEDYQDIFQPEPTPRFDNYDVKTGLYNDYMSYVPIVWTHGELPENRRIKWNTENRHNSYGAPIWKTGVGDVVLRSATAEKQVKGWNTSWQDGNTKCSLYMLDGIEAWGYLPTVSNIEYEPYMFRVFVESENGKLRNFKYVTQVDEQGKEHKVIVADATTVTESKEPLCVWSAYVNDPKNNSENPETPSINGVEFSINGNEITFKKDKVDRTDGYDENGNPLGDWDQQTTNAIFGALDDLEHITQNGQEVINPKDLNIFVRFYYIVKGMSQGWTPWNPTRNAPGLAPAGYGAESPGKAPGHATAVNEIQYLGEIVSQTYYNMQGMVSDKPFDGVNIVVTRFGNGTTSVSKIVR